MPQCHNSCSKSLQHQKHKSWKSTIHVTNKQTLQLKLNFCAGPDSYWLGIFGLTLKRFCDPMSLFSTGIHFTSHILKSWTQLSWLAHEIQIILITRQPTSIPHTSWDVVANVHWWPPGRPVNGDIRPWEHSNATPTSPTAPLLIMLETFSTSYMYVQFFLVDACVKI